MGTTTSGGGRSGDGRRACLTVAVLATLLALAPACGNGGGGDGSETTAGPPPETSAGGSEPAATTPCEDGRPAVVIDVFMLMPGIDQLSQWLADPAYDPVVVAGGPEMLQGYRQRGYDVVYLSALPVDMRVGPQPIAEAIEGWLGSHGFPTGAGTHLRVSWDGELIERALLYKTEVLVELAGSGVSPHYGYANSEDDVLALLNGGIPAERIFTIAPAAGFRDTSPVADADWTEHRRTVVERLGPACLG